MSENGEGGAGAVDHRDVRLVDLVRREEQADDLDFIEETFREERTAGAIAKAGGEDFLLGRPALALEIAAGKTAGGGVLFAVVDGEGEEVLPRAHGGGRGGGDEHDGFASGDGDGAVGELGDRAGGDGDPIFGDRNDMFLIHFSGYSVRCTAGAPEARRRCGTVGSPALPR